MHYALFFDGAKMYMLVCEKAFKAVRLFEKADESPLALRSSIRQNNSKRKLFQKRAMSIRQAGIKQEEFHILDRISTSTPLFVNFVMQQRC